MGKCSYRALALNYYTISHLVKGFYTMLVRSAVSIPLHIVFCQVVLNASKTLSTEWGGQEVLVEKQMVENLNHKPPNTKRRKPLMLSGFSLYIYTENA